MLDTIVLLLSEDMFQINNPDKFTPSANWVFSENKKEYFDMYSRQKPTRKDLACGLYKPRLALSYRMNLNGRYETMLRIEVSIPKLLFGNNFEELKYKDRIPTIAKLVGILKQMGVTTTKDIIAHAPVLTIHYSKNIPLTDGSTPYHFINKIKQANIKLSLDVNQTDYRNEGHSYKWHCNSYEVVFYDKIKDLQKTKISGKRTLGKDNNLQHDQLRKLKRKRKFELLRMEVRLNKRQKIKHLFGKLGIKADLIFKKLFKPAISKKVLLHYLDDIENRRPTLLDYRISSHEALLADLRFNNPHLGIKQTLKMYGLRVALETKNLRELRKMFSACSTRSWYRLMADIKNLSLPTTQKPFGTLRKQLEKFKPLRFRKQKTKKYYF